MIPPGTIFLQLWFTVGIEIERKFLVISDDWRQSEATYLIQGYLNRDTQRTVRVRITKSPDRELAFLTIKGQCTGATRSEFEYPLPVADAQAMLQLADGPLVEKKRHLVEHAGMVWEVDEFFGDNAGLVIAEIELSSESQVFDVPSWIGVEVTEDRRFFNSQLSKRPFSQWPDRADFLRS